MLIFQPLTEFISSGSHVNNVLKIRKFNFFLFLVALWLHGKKAVRYLLVILFNIVVFTGKTDNLLTDYLFLK